MPSLSVSEGLLVLLYAAVLFLPGLLVALAAGLSRWTAAAAAALISYGICATAGPLISAAGLRWAPWSALVAAAVLAAACFALQAPWSLRSRRRANDQANDQGTYQAAEPAAEQDDRAGPRAGAEPRDRSGAEPRDRSGAEPRDRSGAEPRDRSGAEPRDRRGNLVVAAGVAVAALFGAGVLLAAVGTLGAINQDWDASFHANAVRFIIDTGNADPRALRAINDYEATSFFYPNTYHALAAIVGQIGHAAVPTLLNAQMLFLPGIAGLGLAALIRAHGGRVILAACVPLLLVSFSGFPYDLLWRGPLLPYATGVALIPAFMVLLTETLDHRRPAAMVLTAVAAVGLLGLHPSAALSAAIFAVPLVAFRWARRPAAVLKEGAVLLIVAAVTALVGLRFAAGALSVAGTAGVIDWKAIENPGQAVGDLFLLNHGRATPQFWLVALLIVGVLTLSRIRGLWWWLAGTAVFVGGFVAAAAYDKQWAETITQPWWNDRWRFVALAILGLAVVAGNGAVVLADAAVGLVRRTGVGRGLDRRMSVGVAVLVVLAVFGVASGGFYGPANADRTGVKYQAGPTVTPAEEAAMAELASLVGPGERVMNDPGDGSPWMYALDDVVPVFGHVVAPRTYPDIGPDQKLLVTSFRCLDSSAEVRDLVAKYNIRYVFVSDGYVRSTFTRVPGLRMLGQVTSLTPVYAEGGTTIYRIDLTDALIPDSPVRCDATSP